ncbi:hypothetical protein C0J52_23191, partial [Blattella germanica]
PIVCVDCWSKGGDAVNSEFVVTGERSVSSELEKFPVARLFVWKGSCDVEDAENGKSQMQHTGVIIVKLKQVKNYAIYKMEAYVEDGREIQEHVGFIQDYM